MLTTVQLGMQGSPQFYGFKNRIINGAMVIDQRNAGASVTNTTSLLYTVDRWAIYGSVGSKFTAQQNAGSVTPPAGFTNYLGFTSSSAYTVGASEAFDFMQRIEGFNVSDLAWGTANAKTVTLSAWVRSSLTGTFGGAINNSDNSRSYPFSFTISSANTWTQISVTIAGDTSGTWGTTTGTGLTVTFSLGMGSSLSNTAGAWAAGSYFAPTGSTSVVGTSGATFYITGVQLEVGSTSSSFDYRPYGTEFDLCRRYFEIYSGGTTVEGNIPQGLAQVDGANRPEIMLFYYPKRTGPTISTSGNFQANTMANTGIACTYAGTYVGTYTYGSNLFFSAASGVTPNTLSGIVMILFGTSGGGSISISAEL